MRTAVEETFGPWDDDWQRRYFREHFDPALLQVIQVEGQDVGVLYVEERAEEWFVATIELLPAHQGQGIGTAVMRQVMEGAAQQGKPVALRVLKANRRARGLYQRLGFGVTGENETHYIMAWEGKR